MEDKSLVNLTANGGTYDMKTEMLTLVDNVHIVSSTGYEARLIEATIDVHKGSVVSERPVWVKLTNGVINGKKLEIRDSGDVIRCYNGVTMIVRPEQDSDQTR